jgi:ComEC/Rec2-related protein
MYFSAFLPKNHFIRISLHPLFFYTIALIIGIFLQSLSFFFVVFFIWILILFADIFYQLPLHLVISASFLLAGSALYQKNINRYQATQEAFCNSQSEDFIAMITDIFSLNSPFPKYRLTASVQKAISKDSYFNTITSPQIYIYAHDITHLALHDRIMIKAAIIKKPNQESIKTYFRKRGIIGSITLKDSFSIIYRPFYSINRWLFTVRNNLKDHLKKRFSSSTFHLISLLFLGSKDIPPKKIHSIQQDFNNWGIAHYLARSGLHLVLFVMIWEIILKWMPISFFWKNIIVCFLTFLYLIFSWISISFIRSFAAFMMYKIAILLNRSAHPIHLITLITCTTLIYNPFYLFSLDFQLSYGITFALAWINFISTHPHNHSIKKNS